MKGADERSARTKEKLLTAARDLIVEQGWSSVSSRAISARAGINLALINYHFAGKKNLLEAMVDRAVTEITTSYIPAEAGSDLSSFMSSSLRMVPGMVKDPNVRVLAMAMLEATCDEEIASAVKRNLSAFRRLIEDIAHANGLPDSKVSGLATLLAALLDGIMLHFLLDPTTDIEDAAETFKDLSWV